MSGRHTAVPGGADSSTRIVDPNNGHSAQEVFSGNQRQAKQQQTQKGFFSNLGRFGSRKPAQPGALPDYDSSSLQYEVGIRPSFYWLDADLTAAERKQQEAMAKSLKSDCQDEAVVIEDFAGRKGAYFLGVFDGHGPDGRAAAKYAAVTLPKYLAKDPRVWSEDVKKRYKAFKTACYRTNDDLHRTSLSQVNATLSGTTACFAVVQGNSCCVGSTGDSRCIVVRQAADGKVSTEQLSWEAKPEVPDERKRIRMKGGIVAQLQDPTGQPVGAYRVFRRPGDLLPGLAMSRSLGDSLAHSLGVVAKPAFKVYESQPSDLCLVFGTDGVFDVMDNQRVGDFVCNYLSQRDPVVSTADMLTMEAQEQWKTMGDDIIVDDTAAVLLYLRPLPAAQAVHSTAKTIIKAAYTNDTANDMYQLYQQHPTLDPRNRPYINGA